MQTIFDLCQPRRDVLEAQMRDEQFAAELFGGKPALILIEQVSVYLRKLGMANHGKKPRRVLAALRLLLTAT